MRLFKRGREKSFVDLSNDEVCNIFINITNDIESIIKDDKVSAILAKITIPNNASLAEYSRKVTESGAVTLIKLLRHLLETKRDNVYNILAALTLKDRSTYGAQPFKAMLSDVKLIAGNKDFIGFFTRSLK
jgi:hypothetical protein